MAKREIYEVTPADGGWKVQKRGNSRASAVRPTKAEAVERGVELAKAQQLAQLVIRKGDGTIQEERTYGNDPRKTKG